MLACLYEDSYFLVVNKPAGLATCGLAPGMDSLAIRVRSYLTRGTHGGGQVFVGMVSRLDVPVSGLIIVAKTSSAARFFSEAAKNKQIKKIYHTLVSGRLSLEKGILEHGLRIRGAHNKVRCVAIGTPKSEQAILGYRVLERYSRATYLEIQLETGRKHQIRTQLSYVGHPIWGDYKYGSRVELESGIALFSQEIRFPHPQTGAQLTFKLSLPPHWPKDIDERSLEDPTWLGRSK